MATLCVTLLIAHNGFQPVEYMETRSALERAGITVVTVSNRAETATAADGVYTVEVDRTINTFDVTMCNGFFLIGGPGAMENLDTDIVHRKLQEAQRAGISYGAICISPRILLKAGVLKSVRMTGWDGDNALEPIARKYGGILVDEDVVCDGNVVTAVGPRASTAFGQMIARVVKGEAADGEKVL
ncbi:MAG: DJ-1/PfpI family protein [Candidatus Babeliaceae bacterium]|nr:DJ-1/PfpI family protein [Candidatus Babeliaceae bacterium]